MVHCAAGATTTRKRFILSFRKNIHYLFLI
jgi:hypothetical protein